MNSYFRVCLRRFLPICLTCSACSFAYTAHSVSADNHKRPLIFESQPSGQAFVAHVLGRQLIFGPAGTVSGFRVRPRAAGLQPDITMRLIGARPGLLPRGVERQPGAANYLVGPPAQWRLGVPLFRQVEYTNI